MQCKLKSEDGVGPGEFDRCTIWLKVMASATKSTDRVISMQFYDGYPERR